MKKLFHGFAIGVCVALIAAAFQFSGLLDKIEAVSWDWRVRVMAKPGCATDRIHLAIIDQSSLDWAEKQFGVSWPWPRPVYEPILDFCRRAEVKAVVFDMVFSEKSNTPEDDSVFGAAIARITNFVAALPLGHNQGIETNWPEYIPSPPIVFSTDDSQKANAILSASSLPHASFPVSAVAANAALLGSVYASPDSDAVFRRLPLFHMFDGRPVPALGLAALLADTPQTELKLKQSGLQIENFSAPLDSEGRMILRYRGPTQTHKAVNAVDLIRSELRILEGKTPIISPETLKDRFVFLGVTAPGLMDLKPTPVGRTYPGVEIQATLLDNLLSRDFIRTATTSFWLFVLLVLSLSAGVMGRFCRSAWQTCGTYVLLLPIPFVLGITAYHNNVWLPVVVQELGVILGLVSAAVVNYAVEGRQKRFIKGAFKQYLSPALIDQLVINPKQLMLGGEKRELSIFFSDIQDFTSFSEELAPESLTALLNRYLTAMTDIIMEEGGTIDKYEGDAIIAFWNAPIKLTNHAVRAVRAAIRCQQKLDEIRPVLLKEFGKEIYARIGVNTGPVVVGNMGSNQRFDYTFLGDAGNLASRLEGINKQFGTYLLISESTMEKLDDSFAFKEISLVRVAGRKQAVRIFEPIFRKNMNARREELEAFKNALQLYYDGDFRNAGIAFNKLANIDPVAKRYAYRCDILVQSPPTDWSGVWNIKEK